MKKTIIAISALALIMLVVSSMPLSVKAHPGRTDGNGGHTNRSTGEYHYHHGYSAHDHYDMDGDGDVDCPYDFNDRTGASSGDGSGRNNNYSEKTYSSNAGDRSGNAGTISNSKRNEEPSFWYKLISIVASIGSSIMLGLTITIMLLQLLNGLFGWDFSVSIILFAFIGISAVIYFLFFPIV